MSTINISSYKKLYLQIAAENCETIEENCSEALQNLLDKDALQNIYISAHSLKSKSQVMGYSKIGELSGMIEKEAKNFLDQDKMIPKDLINTIIETETEIKTHLKNIKEEVIGS